MVNVARIRYTTAHFNVLKGLAIVPWGIYYLLGASLCVWGASSLNDAAIFAMMLIGFCLAGLAQLLLLACYQRTLGFVGNPTRTGQNPFEVITRHKQMGIWIGFVLVTTLVGLLAIWGTGIIDVRFASMFIYRLLLAIVLCLFCLTLWLHKRIKEGYGHVPVWPLAVYLILTLDPPGVLRS